MQKVHQSSAYKDELNAFLIVAFISSAVICAIFATLIKRGEKRYVDEKEKGKSKKQGWLLLLIMVVPIQ